MIKQPPVQALQGPGTLALLMALSALGQLGVNLALPILPVIGQAVGLAAGDTGLILSAYLLGLAAGQLVVGPLSDRVGRRPVLLSGLALFALAGLGSAFATEAASLLVLRAAQGVGASASLALARAVARDLFDGPALVRVIALITMAMAVVPGLAPIFGGMLTESAGWRGALGFAGVAGAAMLWLTAIRLPETNASPLPALNGRKVARLYAGLFGNGAFMRNALSNALLLAALYGFFAGAPLVLIGPAPGRTASA